MNEIISQKFDNSEKGQTLIIIFLVMILALSIGVSVSSRFIKTVSTITQTDQATRALAVAESAVEHILMLPVSTLEDFVNNGNCGSECYLEITDAEGQAIYANIELTKLGDSSEPYVVDLKLDESTQISLSGYPNNVPVYVCWNKDGMSVSGLYIKGTVGNYEADAFSYNSSNSFHGDNNFDTASPLLGYNSCFSVNSEPDSVFLRLKAYYEEGLAIIMPATGFTLPSQGILIKSTGVAGNTTRVVTVIITDPVLPGQFDYVLYQKSQTEPLSN